ncbi:lanthionine synthetase C family protein [Shouchella lonarensis]|nr:lanthionine synthetase C family protein [Shouchella lonarensis]
MMRTLDHYEKRARAFGEQLADMEALKSLIDGESQQYPTHIQHLFYHFSYVDIGNGVVGHCLYLAEMDQRFPGEGYDGIAHHLLQQVINSHTLPHIDDPGLWSGLAGICFTIAALSKNGTRYTSVLHQLHQKLHVLTSDKLVEAEEHLAVQQVKMPDYDLMGGLAGTALYLIEASVQDARLRSLSQQVLDYLCRLAMGTKDVNGVQVPAWHIAAENQFLEEEKVMYPEGNVNLGISHGITGVLCALLRAKRIEIYHSQLLHDAVRTLSDWLVSRHERSANGQLCWEKRPPFASFAQDNKRQVAANVSWCYGDPMIAKTLWDAGDVLKDKGLQDFALDCFKSLQPTFHQPGLIAPTYCHGIAGTLHVVDAMYKKTADTYFADISEQLQKMLNDDYEENTVFGFRDVEEMNQARFTFQKPGLLTGAAGIYLTLLSVNEPSTCTGWERLFAVD